MTNQRLWKLMGIALGALFLITCTLPQLTSSPSPPTTPSPALSPSPSPTLTPTPVPTLPPENRFTIAEEAYTIGDWERAEAAYSSLLDHAPEALREGAQVGLAKTLIASGAISEGITTLYNFLDLYPTSSLTSEAHLRLADIYLQHHQGGVAIHHYQQVLQGPYGSTVAPYAHEWLGDAYYTAESYQEALESYGAALAEAKTPSRRVFLLEKIALSHAALGDEAATLAAYDTILAEARIPTYRARILYQSAQSAKLFNDTPEYLARLRQLMTTYPDQHYGYLALVELLDAGETVDDLLRGKIDYWEGAYSPAVQALYRYLDAHPEHDGEAHIYIARAFLAAGSYDLAIQETEKLIQTHPANDPWWDDGWLLLGEARQAAGDLDGAEAAWLHLAEAIPQSPLAPAALWKSAELHESQDDLTGAADRFLDLAARYPEDSGAPEAIFRAGLDRYRADEFQGAIAAWARMSAYPRSERAQAARFWSGRAWLRAGQPISGTTALQEAQAMDPWSYYGIRAADWLEGRAPMSAPTEPPSPCADDVEATRRWIADWSGEPIEPWPPTAIADDPRLARGLLLLHWDHFDEGKAELESLRHDTAESPLAQYAISLAARNAGLYRTSLLAAAGVWRKAPSNDFATLPRSLACLIYPTYYTSLIEQAAIENGFAPLQLYALIRQESLFEGQATSWASAHGLMQIIPQTGASIAAALGWPPDYTTDDLYRPIVSVRFGTWYLAQQRDRFDGHLLVAVAAYNGGPTNAATWWEKAGHDDDLFVEMITLQETRRYVEAITEHLKKYLLLYAQ